MRHFFRNLITICMLIILLCNFVVSAAGGYYYDGSFHEYTAEPITLKVNGEVIEGDMPPILLNDRTMVPAFFVFSSLDAYVSWNAKTRQVTIIYDGNNILLTIDSRKVLLNGKAIYIAESDPPAKIINDRTMIPARFVSENLGLEVDWNGTTRTVFINSPIPTAAPTVKPTAKPTPKPTVSPTAKPTAKPTIAPTETPKPTSSPASGVITSVTYEDNTITIKGKGLSDYKISTLKNPMRYIFDFNDVSFSGVDRYFKYDEGPIQELRYATHDGYARVVLETVGEIDYSYSSTSKVFKITIGENATEVPTIAPTTAPITSEAPSNPTATPKPTYAPRKQNENPIVVLDAGHGGSDPGALGKNEDGEVVAQEKDINLAVTLKVYALLQNAGIDTYLTRKDDTYVSLGNRSDFANNLNADLFVSIHSNAIANTTTNGMMVMYNPNSAKNPNPYYFTHSTELATFILDHMDADTDLKNLGLRDGSDLWVIRKTLMPAVLVELGFITNESDRNKLTDDAYQDVLAESIYKGILDALEKAE